MSSEQNPARPQAAPYRDRSAGPIGFIILAAFFVFWVVNRPLSNASNRETNESTFNGTAVLSGVERRSNSEDFRSGSAQAFMGGVKFDLRDALMQRNEARIDVTAVMGGVEIRVPKDWTVVNRTVTILGGVNDRTVGRDSEKKLILEGTVVMGGLEIKN